MTCSQADWGIEEGSSGVWWWECGCGVKAHCSAGEDGGSEGLEWPDAGRSMGSVAVEC